MPKRKVAEKLSLGEPWTSAGTPTPYARNGAAMRSAPIGLLFWHDFEQLISAACSQGRVTHQDIDAQAGAVAIAGATTLALLSEKIEPQQFLENLSNWVGTVSETMADRIRELKDYLLLPPEQVVLWAANTPNLPPTLLSWSGISPDVTASVLWSLYSFLRSPENYWETICTAISPGGDVDTTAAMAGAISGAYNGLSAIPKEIAIQVNDRGTWDYESLLKLADRCFDLSMSISNQQQFVDFVSEQPIGERWDFAIGLVN